MKTARTLALFVIIILSLSCPAKKGFTQEKEKGPVQSGSEDFLSPVSFSTGSNSVFAESPPSAVLNPAIPGGLQTTTLDFNYLSLAGLGEQRGFGHALNAGISIPTRVGVFSGSGRFFTPPYGEFYYDQTFGSLDLSFSKDLYREFYIGAGLGFSFGSDWGLGLDLGFVHFPGDLAFLKDFRWGFTFRNIGKPYADPGFTPAFASAFKLIRTEPVNLSMFGDLSFPSFRDIRFSVGAELSLFDFFFLDVTGIFDYDYRNENARTLPLSFGAAFQIPLGKKKRERAPKIKANISAAPLQDDVWAFGGGVNIPTGVLDTNPPVIETDTTKRYISPNFDGVKDELTIPLKITDERYVKGYRFIVENETGEIVKTIRNKEERPETTGVKNVFQRLVAVKEGITVPETLTWDGKSDSGTVVPDGNYRFYIEAWDDNANLGKSGIGEVVVDNTPPTAEISSPYKVFSPDSDGLQDVLIIRQSGSREDLWKGAFKDTEGSIVREFTWKEAEPPSFEWDGKNSQGILPPDGVYGYVLSSTDMAGNIGEFTLENIIINTMATPVGLNIDHPAFSPNEDGVKDELTFGLEVPVKEGIVRWELAVVDSEGGRRRVYRGGEEIVKQVVFDGKDDTGRVLPEGRYQGRLEVLYINGNNPKESSPWFTIDLTAPSAAVKADLDVFSPNGDGNKDVIVFYQDSSTEEVWEGRIMDAEGEVVKRYNWRGNAERRVQWDGRGDDGMVVADGVYRYVLKAVDSAGNTGGADPVSFSVDTRETPVQLAVNLTHFSPNSDGVKDGIRIIPTVPVTDGIESYELRIEDEESGDVVRRFSGRGRVPDVFEWDGFTGERRRASDGRYFGELEVVYRHGNRPVVRTASFVLDTVYPEVRVSAEVEVFSPDGDGRLDTLRITQSSGEEDLWEGKVLDARGRVIREYYWKGRAESFAWDGKDGSGNRVPDGTYSYVVSAQDKAGNLTRKELKGLRVDTRPAPLYITVSERAFSPNDDGDRDTVTFKPYVGLKEGIKSWTLTMVHEELGAQKTFKGGPVVPESIVWEGKVDRGATAPNGIYHGLMQVEYFKGNLPTAKTTTFRLDTLPPKVDITLSPVPFSPDNDGVDDELSISMRVEDISPINRWHLEIRDPVGNHFTSYSGRGEPTRTIIWHGISDTGELVQSAEDYPLTFTISDELGNTTRIEKTIKVDVLVIREGNRLKISISSIVFAPYTADYLNVEEERRERNIATLKRLAEILKKYSAYRILIEGHAVMEYWDNPARAKREQEEELIPLSKARAEAVKNALVEYGIDSRRISTKGVGGAQPVVPHGDLENRWKNRRVEFILIK